MYTEFSRKVDALHCRNAFTLAEVLVTIAIIGLVATLTIPSLISSYRKKVVETKLVRFYSTINQALNFSEIENGSRHYWDTLGSFCEFQDEEDGSKSCVDGTEDALMWYNKYLAKYIKVLKVGLDMDYSYDVPENPRPTDVLLYFPDGSLLQFSGRGWNYYIRSKDLVQNGRPEHWGTIAFPFIFDESGKIEPCCKSASSTFACAKNGNGAGCTAAIAKNGWKIPRDYPYKF